MHRDINKNPEWYWLALPKPDELQVAICHKAWLFVKDIYTRVAERRFPDASFITDYSAGRWGLDGQLTIATDENNNYATFSCPLNTDTGIMAAQSLLLLFRGLDWVILSDEFDFSQIETERKQLAEIIGCEYPIISAYLSPIFVEAVCRHDPSKIATGLLEVVRGTHLLINGREHRPYLDVSISPSQFRWEVDGNCACFSSGQPSDRMLTEGCEMCCHNIDYLDHLLMVLTALAYLWNLARD
jgi:hypothetical protein